MYTQQQLIATLTSISVVPCESLLRDRGFTEFTVDTHGCHPEAKHLTSKVKRPDFQSWESPSFIWKSQGQTTDSCPSRFFDVLETPSNWVLKPSFSKELSEVCFINKWLSFIFSWLLCWCQWILKHVPLGYHLSFFCMFFC